MLNYQLIMLKLKFIYNVMCLVKIILLLQMYLSSVIVIAIVSKATAYPYIVSILIDCRHFCNAII